MHSSMPQTGLMIKVSRLSKYYGPIKAVDNVSFTVQRGEIVGFLGPNGAGKSTTLRILSGYLPASGGEVNIAGHDVFTESLEVRRRIGYLPENCPLYPEMRVDEYLTYRGKLKGLSSKTLPDAMDRVLAQCALGDVKRRIIGQLSKGFRQRVGLADALIHDPELLILDEPTVGLDPNQIRHVRDLIRGLSKTHTILLSTHILSEVETTCDRVLIINEGRIMASDTPRGLQNMLFSTERLVVDILAPEEEARMRLAALPGVRAVRSKQHGAWSVLDVECDALTDPRVDIFKAVNQAGWTLRELRRERRTLEDVFVELTKGTDAGRRL